MCQRCPILVDEGLVPHRKETAVVAKVFVLSAVVLVLVAVPLLCYGLYMYHSERHTVAWYVGGLSLAVTVPLTIYDISMHVLFYVRPEL